MVTENEIRERFSGKAAEYAQRIQIVEERLQKERQAEKPRLEEIARLEEKLTQLQINVRDCVAKVKDAAVVAARRSMPHDRKASGQALKPKGVESVEKFGKV